MRCHTHHTYAGVYSTQRRVGIKQSFKNAQDAFLYLAAHL